MSWFFGRKKDNEPPLSDLGQGVKEQFDAIIALATQDDEPAQRAAIAHGVAFSWQIFNAEFGSAEVFLELPLEAQAKYIEKATNAQQALAESQPLTALGFTLTTLHIVSMIKGQTAMINYMAERLEPLNREGSALLGMAAPTDETEADTDEEQELLDEPDTDERELWAVIFQASVAIAEVEERARKVMEPDKCRQIVDELISRQGYAISEKETVAASMTVQAIRGSEVIAEVRKRWSATGQRSFGDDDIQRATAVVQEFMNEFMRTQR